MQIINDELLNRVTAQAKESPRLRMNHNLHENLEAKAQRLLNALEPGTVLPIHRHQTTAETYFVLRGRLRVQFYSDSKEIVEECELDPRNGNYGVNIPAGQWHTLEVLESGTVIFEVKEGPYIPITPENLLK